MFSSLLQRLRNASVARKIDLILFPPMLIMVLLVTLILSRMLGQMGDARTAEHVIALSTALSEVAHNHAVERGLTAGFIASKGQNAGNKLAAQRLKADTATSDLKRAIDSSFVRGLSQQHREHLDELLSELEYIPALRSEVDALDDSNSPFDVYSGINKMALDISGELSTLIQDISLVNAVHSLNGLLWLIERSGQERGALNGVFTRGDYSLSELLSVNKYVEDQNAQLDYIARNMDSNAFVEVMGAMSSDANMQVLELRQAFFTAANNQGEMPSDAPAWFALSTERIKAIKQVANSQTTTLAATASDKVRNAAIIFVALSVMAALLCWTMFTFSRMLSLQIRLRVEGLTSKLNTVAQAKDFSSRIDDDGTDELGQAATAFNSLLAELQRAISATTTTVSAVAEGRFDTRINEQFEGDLALLKEGVNQSSEKVDNTMAALAEVMRALAAGDFSARMDDRVEGAFKRQVDGAMQATESAINSVSHVIEAMSQGDFSARIEQDLPGSLGGLKNSVNDSLDNISAAMRDISECIQAQKVGRFSWRIRNQYQGELEILKSGINDSMSSIDEALQDLNRIFRHIRRGDYSLRIDRQMHGDLAEMKEGVNASITELDAAISEIVNVAAAQQQGQLSARITGKYQGQLAELKESLNSSGSTLNTTVDLISELMFKVKDGDFSGRIQLPMLGVFNDLKDAINESLAALQSAVRDLTEVATGQKKGELFRRMGRAHVGELAIIRDAVNASMSNLSDIVKQVQDSSSQTINMTNEQSTATTEMSQRTEGQAAALQQIASTMQEIASAAGNTEKRCELISTEFNKAMQASEEGASTIDNTVVSMTEMKDSSQKIANITGLIDEIAFQTNLLALNAAVEAARAGEQGRGFAVVAAEVRDLAQRSGSAARSIKELIEDNVSKVDNAWNLGQQSKKHLSHIYEILSNSAKLTKEVSQAAAEQNQGVQEINSAISSLDSMTQENAAMVEQTKAATMTVEEQSTRMHALLGFFVLQRAV